MTNRPAAHFLRIALRRAARGTGSLPELYKRRTAVQPLPDLERILGSLRWVLVGGIALRAYMPERMTLDVGILVHERDAGAARAAFIAAGYHVVGQLSVGGFTVQLPTDGSPAVDILTRTDIWLDDALAHPPRDPASYPVLDRPHLILMKLQAGRTQDLAMCSAYSQEPPLRNAQRSVY